MEAAVEKVQDFIPSSMDRGIEPFHNVDQMVEIPSFTKLDVRNFMHEDEHEDAYFLALGGKPVVVSVATFDMYVLPLLPNALEVDRNQVYELMVQTLRIRGPIHYGLQVLIEEDYAGSKDLGMQAKMQIARITTHDSAQVDQESIVYQTY